MVSKKTINTLLASAVAFTVAGGISAANAMDGDKEKCFGVVKAGHNDCASADKSHSCAGHAAEDGSANEWVALPAGTCDKLAHGSLTPGGVDDSAAHDAVEAVKDHAKDMMDKH